MFLRLYVIVLSKCFVAFEYVLSHEIDKITLCVASVAPTCVVLTDGVRSYYWCQADTR
jgi:hypothetical protein